MPIWAHRTLDGFSFRVVAVGLVVVVVVAVVVAVVVVVSSK